ncbi:MAG: hypothetical protein JWN46_44 [Acidimicrobiales bacterium]|nr:hypothetical protein [Acidimicrobiales bacterium]
MADHVDREAHDHLWPDRPMDLLTDARAWTVAALVASYVIVRRLRRTVGSIPAALPRPHL